MKQWKTGKTETLLLWKTSQKCQKGCHDTKYITKLLWKHFCISTQDHTSRLYGRAKMVRKLKRQFCWIVIAKPANHNCILRTFFEILLLFWNGDATCATHSVHLWTWTSWLILQQVGSPVLFTAVWHHQTSQLLPCSSCGRCLRQFSGSLPTVRAYSFWLVVYPSSHVPRQFLSTFVGTVPWNQTPLQMHRLILSLGSWISLAARLMKCISLIRDISLVIFIFFFPKQLFSQKGNLLIEVLVAKWQTAAHKISNAE